MLRELHTSFPALPSISDSIGGTCMAKKYEELTFKRRFGEITGISELHRLRYAQRRFHKRIGK